MFQVLGVVGLMLSSASVGADKATVEVTAISASGEKKDKDPEMDDGCKKFAEDLKTFKYAKYKTAGSKTLSLGAKESETCEFGNYKVTVKVKEITEEKVKISMAFLKGNEEVGKQTVTLTPGGKAQLTEIDEGNSKATLFALGVAKNK